MSAFAALDIPLLNARHFGARSLPVITDDALFERIGVRIGFTGREGGVSEGPYASLNLGSHVEDNPDHVSVNRQRLADAFNLSSQRIIVPHQIHQDVIELVSGETAARWQESLERAQAGVDGLVVQEENVMALLCFADCVPVIIVSPTGRFAVVHAGWRGVVARIAPQAARMLHELDINQNPQGAPSVNQYNVYIGPHIHSCCFETGDEVAQRFERLFGKECVLNNKHVSLRDALSTSLQEVGVVSERIADSSVCTRCRHNEYFSYRASGGVCGRHAAFAFRQMSEG